MQETAMAEQDEGRRRRDILRVPGLAAAGAALAGGALAQGGYPAPSPIDSGRVENGRVLFPNWRAEQEPASPPPPAPEPPARRVGIAVVALGRISLEEVLPAFGECRHARPVALVSGNREKARTVAAQYGISEGALHDYAGFERLRDDPAVEAVYIALPNAMHHEYTLRAAAIGKHVLCEKPMANSSAECREMIAACERAGVRLMIAYRAQYEPYNRAAIGLVRGGRLGRLRFIEATNVQANGPGPQWRYSRRMAGGGALPDIGIYCLSAARYLTGEEPIEVQGWMQSPPGDARFAEVEESCGFRLRFPSGTVAQAISSYGAFQEKTLRAQFEAGALEMPDAFAYRGQKLRITHKGDGSPVQEEMQLRHRNQFALELDHFAQCIRAGRRPHTPGEEGLQDQLIMEAIAASAAADGRLVRLEPPPGPTRGPEPQGAG
jgi:predicted dehydrogenase